MLNKDNKMKKNEIKKGFKLLGLGSIASSPYTNAYDFSKKIANKAQSNNFQNTYTSSTSLDKEENNA